MKRITLIMAAIVCLAISAMAQPNAACDRRFGKKIEEIKSQFPQGYTLDNLNDVYGGQGRKWEKIYNEFKKEEGRGGSINDLKELVSPQIWKLVEPDFTAYITEHPELANAVPDPAGQGDEKTENVQEGENGDTTTAAGPKDKASDNGFSCNANLPLWLGILGSLLGLCALLISLSNRGKIKEMRRAFTRELDRTNANLQEFSTDAANQMKALSIRMTGKVPHDYKEEVEDIVEQPVLNLFTSKPDENDDFTRVSDTFEPGNSIYVLTTFDGQHGKFEVIDKPEVHTFALMMPAENLIRACSGNAIQIPSGTRIVTDRPGEAEFIDGKWHVVVKAIIHYEN